MDVMRMDGKWLRQLTVNARRCAGWLYGVIGRWLAQLRDWFFDVYRRVLLAFGALLLAGLLTFAKLGTHVVDNVPVGAIRHDSGEVARLMADGSPLHHLSFEEGVSAVLEAVDYYTSIRDFMQAREDSHAGALFTQSTEFPRFRDALESGSSGDVERWIEQVAEAARRRELPKNVVDYFEGAAFRRAVFIVVDRLHSTRMLREIRNETIDCHTSASELKARFPLAKKSSEVVVDYIIRDCIRRISPAISDFSPSMTLDTATP